MICVQYFVQITGLESFTSHGRARSSVDRYCPPPLALLEGQRSSNAGFRYLTYHIARGGHQEMIDGFFLELNFGL